MPRRSRPWNRGSALARIFVEAVLTMYRSLARRDGLEDTQCGAVNFVQRFGSLNLHVPRPPAPARRRVRPRRAGPARVPPGRCADRRQPEPIVARAARRSVVCLRKHGHPDDSPLEARSNETPVHTALDACAAIAKRRGKVASLPHDGSQARIVARDERAAGQPAAWQQRAARSEESVAYCGSCAPCQRSHDAGRNALTGRVVRPPHGTCLTVLSRGHGVGRVKFFVSGLIQQRFRDLFELSLA